MKLFKKLSQIGAGVVVAVTPALAQATTDVQGYWAGGYVDGKGGEIQFELTIIDGIGQLKYNASNWGALGFAICEYVFAVENGQPGKITRNSGAGTGECLADIGFQITRPNLDALSLAFANPEIDLEAAELAGILRPFDPSEAHAPIEGLDVLGAAPGMTQEQIEAILAEKDYERQPNRDRPLEYEGFTVDQLAWARNPNADGEPTDWIFATFTAKKSWAPDEVPVATYVGRDWSIPESEALAAATLADSLAKKYGARSNTINEDRLYDRAGKVIEGYSCPEGSPHQAIQSNYTLEGEVGTEDIAVTCGSILKAMVIGDSSTGRASVLKLRLTDPDPLRADFWKTWSHSEGARLKTVHDGVTGATGKAPDL